MAIPDEMSEQISHGHPTFEQNIRGHAFNALTASLGADPWLPLSRRKEIADAIGDAILAFLAPLGLNDAVWQPEGRGLPRAAAANRKRFEPVSPLRAWRRPSRL